MEDMARRRTRSMTSTVLDTRKVDGAGRGRDRREGLRGCNTVEKLDREMAPGGG
jgi:hypothetical protein